MWPCVAESPTLKPLVTGGGAAGLYRRLQHIEAAAPAGVAGYGVATRDVVPLDPREVSLLLRMEQGGDIVHSSVHTLSAVLGEEVRDSHSDSDERLAGLVFHFGNAPALTCRQHERFPSSLSLTLCAVRSDGTVASIVSTTLLNHISGYHFGGRHHYAANPTLEGSAPTTQNVNLADMFTATEDVLPLSFVDALVKDIEEVQAYRLQFGGPMTVTVEATIHLGHFVMGQDDSTPLAERHHFHSDDSFSVLDGIRICPEGVWIDCLGMSFSLFIDSEKLDDYDVDPEFGTLTNLPLRATVALLNERLVVS
jgi:hypothetical protein